MRDQVEEAVLGRANTREKKKFRERAVAAVVVLALAVVCADGAFGAHQPSDVPVQKIFRGEAAPRGRYLYAANLILKPGFHFW